MIKPVPASFKRRQSIQSSLIFINSVSFHLSSLAAISFQSIISHSGLKFIVSIWLHHFWLIDAALPSFELIWIHSILIYLIEFKINLNWAAWEGKLRNETSECMQLVELNQPTKVEKNEILISALNLPKFEDWSI